MVSNQAGSPDSALRDLERLLPDLEALYKDVHSHPELSMQETRTAALAADHLRAAGFEVTADVGKTGVVGLLRNGEGPTVMLRADMDALPVEEATGLPYASKITAKDQDGKTVPVGHMCGHDMHVTWLVGATKLLAEAKTRWRGTIMAVFQPGEETAEGAQAMIDDGLFKRFPKPDVVLGQHVMVGPSGTVAGRAGAITSAADSLQIRLFGRGAHGSMPQASIDPVVMAAATVMRLQTIVSREIAAAEAAVVTIGVLQAGTKENVIPDEAIIKLNVRTFSTPATGRACWLRSSGSSMPRRQLPALLANPRSRRWITILSTSTTGRPASGWLTRSGGISVPSASGKRGLPQRARTSDRSGPNGTCPRLSGSSAAPIRRLTKGRRRRTSSPSYR